MGHELGHCLSGHALYKTMLSLLIPVLARLSVDPGWLAWVAPPHVPYAPALAARGVVLERLLLVQGVSAEEGLWAVEQAMKSGACTAVLAWTGEVRGAQLRRLQLAAEQGGCLGVLFRGRQTAAQASPAALRLRAQAAAPGLAVEVLKRRGGWSRGRCVVPVS